MTNTTYYNLNIVEGTDIVNPLTVDNPNYETIDEAMHNNAVSGVTLATEIANATVHAITRENSECAVIRFIATSEWKAGDTVTVDSVPVTALLPSGETLPDGAYVINANVLCILTGTYMTVFAERKKTDHANEIIYKDTNVEQELNKIEGQIQTGDYVSILERYGVTGEASVPNLTSFKSLLIIYNNGSNFIGGNTAPIKLFKEVFTSQAHALRANGGTETVGISYVNDTTIHVQADSQNNRYINVYGLK